MRLKFVVLILCAAGATKSSAHGPQIQLTGESGKITTRRLILDGPYSDSLTPVTSVYVMPLKEYLGAWYPRPNDSLLPGDIPEFFSGPGFAYGYGFDSATPAVTPFTAGAKFGLTYTAGLKRWNGSSFADAGATELVAFTGGNPEAPTATAKTSDTGPFASLAVPAGAGTISFTAEGDEVHSTVRYRLLGDGTLATAPSADGVYLLGLQLSISSGDKTPSDPFYYVLTKNASAGDVSAAVASLGFAPNLVQTIVPEPGSASLTLLGVSVLGATRRRLRR